ncbi:unnamed protein product, partial [Sphenostylis stenocarpa]
KKWIGLAWKRHGVLGKEGKAWVHLARLPPITGRHVMEIFEAKSGDMGKERVHATSVLPRIEQA